MSNKKWGFLITGSDGEAVFTEAEVVEKSKFDELQSALDELFANPHVDLEGMVYDVRESELQGWDGPWVKQWSDAISKAFQLLSKINK